MKKFNRKFYLQDTFEVAKKLLGSTLYTFINGELTGGKIVEIEPYLGGTDKASHSYLGKRTNRTEIQFGIGGHAYIFLVYGIHYQFCVVTREKGVSDVLLIRALEPIKNIDIMKKRRNNTDLNNLTNGPGKLCSALSINKDLYGADLCGNKIWIVPPNKPVRDGNIIQAARIGIKYAEEYFEKLWRFYIKDNKFVSVKVPQQKIINNKEIFKQ